MRDVDPIGQALAVTFLFSVVFILIQGREMGGSAAPSIAISVVAALALLGFLRHESRRSDPFIDLRFFHSIPFASATVIAVCAYAAYGAFLFMMSLYLQGARHYSAVHTGLMYLPISVAALTLSPLSGRLVGRFGSRPSLLAAGIMITVATLMLAGLTVTSPIGTVALIFAVFGAGFAMANAPITTTAVSGMPTDRAGSASAVASTSRQVGVSIGVALCGSLAGAALTASGAQYTADARPLWLLCAMLGLVITALAIWSTSPSAIRSADRLAPLIAGPALTKGERV
jgi:predicted MFS family arabinose efflux permease